MKELVESTPGATGAIFVDWEGEAVDQYAVNEEDLYHLKVIGAHKGVMLNLIHDAQKAAEYEAVRSVAVRMENYNVLMAPVKDGYFVAMTMTHDTVMGKARYCLAKTLEALKKEM